MAPNLALPTRNKIRDMIDGKFKDDMIADTIRYCIAGNPSEICDRISNPLELPRARVLKESRKLKQQMLRSYEILKQYSLPALTRMRIANDVSRSMAAFR
jgi:hypothetical protein